ncbi:MAG TPA: protein kinase [Pyrinomonadaceae bacterium]|jgi:serine/threonine protein kinase
MFTFTPLPVGTIWQGRYEAIEDQNSSDDEKHILGKGGMGAVYLAHDKQLDCEVAIKQTLLAADAGFINAFRQEARLLANLSHPALPRVSGLFNEHSSYFLVMELIRGDNLLEMINKSGGKLPFKTVLKITLELLDVMDYLHTQKTPIIHKDIKPANLKLTPRGQLKLLDFGLAKGSAGLMTEHGSSILKGNTPAYASPEQDAEMSTDAQSDLYSAAATLFHLATGKTPPHCRIRFQHVAFKKSDPLRLASEINTEIPNWFAEILHKALSLSPDERLSSAEEMEVQIRERQKAEIERQRQEAESKRLRLEDEARKQREELIKQEEERKHREREAEEAKVKNIELKIDEYSDLILEQETIHWSRVESIKNLLGVDEFNKLNQRLQLQLNDNKKYCRTCDDYLPIEFKFCAMCGDPLR